MKKRGKMSIFKKAQTRPIYHILFQVLIAVTVYWILQSYIDSVAKDTMFEKSYLSKDLALLIDTIYSSPGEVDYLYTNDRAELNKFEFDFDKQKVSVVEIEGKEKIKVEYPYGEDLRFPYSGKKIQRVNQIALSKTKSNLEINPNFKSKIEKIKCPDINTKLDVKKLRILIYSSEAGTAENIGKKLAEKLKSSFKEATYSDLDKAKAKSKDFDLILGVKFNIDDKEKNVIKTSIYSLASEDVKEKSHKLACRMINKLIDEDYPITYAYMGIYDLMPIKEKDKINVVLDLGNIKNSVWINTINDEDKANGLINSLSATIIQFYQNEK